MGVIGGPYIKRDGLVFGYDTGYGIADNDTSTRFYPGEPTTNLVPGDANKSFTTSNNWRTYNTNQYNGAQYFSIGTVGSITNNIVTLSSVGRTIRSFDVLRAQTSGGGITAGTNYVIKKISSTTFSLHAYNGSQDGSQGYINPSTGFYKVHDAYANDTRININATDFPTMWWGAPHLPNSGLIKEIVEGGGKTPGTNCMRLHVYRGDGVSDGMAYGVYTPVTQGDVITVTYWLRAATPNAANKGGSYTTYFGAGNASFGQGFACGEYNKWVRIKHQWTASVTYNFYQYWFPQGSGDKYSIDIADLQVEVNKGHATPFILNSRSSTQSLIDLTRTTTIDVSNVSFDSTGQPTFDGTDDRIDSVTGVGITDYSQPFTMECVFMVPTGATWANGFSSNIFSIGGAYAGQYGIYKYGTDGVGFQIRDATTGTYLATAGLLRDTYYHITAVFQGGSGLTLYRNGVSVSTSSTSFTGAPDTTNLYIGGARAFGGMIGSWFQGEIPVAKYYNRALTSQEVQQNFRAYKNRFNI